MRAGARGVPVAVMDDTSRMADDSRPIEVHLFAAARSAAGTEVLLVRGGTVAEALATAVGAAPGLEAVLGRCSVLVDGVATHDHAQAIGPGTRLDVLPPFAGG